MRINDKVVVVTGAGQRADLTKTAGIRDLVNALADGQAPRAMLAGDVVRAAHFLGERTSALKLVDLGCPEPVTVFRLFVCHVMASIRSVTLRFDPSWSADRARR